MNDSPRLERTTLIELVLRPIQPWAVGAFTGLTADNPDEEEPARLPVVRDAQGRPHATSLAGGLRAHLGAEAATWLGALRDKGTTASSLRLLTATVTEAGRLESRMTTAIDAGRRAARVHTLRKAEHVAPVGHVVWRILWDHTAEEHHRLRDLLRLLATWRPVIGRARSTGQGQAMLAGLRHWTCDRDKPEHLTWWLTERGNVLAGRDAASPPSGGWVGVELDAAEPPTPVLDVLFEVVDALHLGKERKDEGRGKGNELDTFEEVAGTTWKGVFRHRVEHILRVTGESDAGDVVSGLFGESRAEEDSGARGKLRFTPSPVTAPDGIRRVTQVGIDRISGGALMNTKDDPRISSGSLYTVAYLPAGSTLRLQIFSDDELSDREQRLLSLVKRDLDEGIIGIGGMTTRGFGTIKEKAS